MTLDERGARSRRTILSGAAAGAAAFVAAGIARPLTVDAANPVILGSSSNSATTVTVITNSSGNGFSGVGSGSGYGVEGNAVSGAGVQGDSSTGIGVVGQTLSDTQPAILGHSAFVLGHGRNTGVQGYSGGGATPDSPYGTGVFGSSDIGDGVVGRGPNRGVYGLSSNGIGVSGETADNRLPAVQGVSYGGGTAVLGYSGPSIPPAGRPKTAVYGFSNADANSVGVRGQSPAGRGGMFVGGAAQIRLVASAAATHPASGLKGDLFVDRVGRLWFCRGTTTWHRLA